MESSSVHNSEGSSVISKTSPTCEDADRTIVDEDDSLTPTHPEDEVDDSGPAVPPTFVASFKCSNSELGKVFGAVQDAANTTPVTTDESNQVGKCPLSAQKQN